MAWLQGKKTIITSLAGLILGGLGAFGVVDQTVLGGADPGTMIQVALSALFIRLGMKGV